MKQKLIFSTLFLSLFTLTFISCKDEELTEEERQQKQEQENDRQFLLTSEFWQVVGQLSTAEVLPDDWQNTTFEPGIGQASDKSTTTRIVLTNEAEAAAESFENLTGVELNGLTAYEWKRDFGSLTYKQLNDGTAWAEVEVDIKQMPGLKRIVYCTPEQQGLNASVPGTPYYRFGDVIKKKNANSEWEYWVCVRPCFGPEKKGDMHWMCLGSLPESHIETYTYTKQNRQWWWYKSLTTDYEHIKNLSEMTFAILNPTEWADYYDVNPYKCMFHDFSHENISYHNRYFWQMVQKAWNTKLDKEGGKTVFELLFHRTMDEVKKARQLNYFYGSASGPSWSTWNMKMQTISVRILPSDPQSFQCRDLVKKNIKESCEHKEFDIREYSNLGRPNNSNIFIDSVYIYPLRCATGKELLGTQPNCYQSMDGSNGIQDVYVFNKHYNQGTGSTTQMNVFTELKPKGKPMAEVSKEDIGKLLAKNGKIYEDAQAAEKDGTKAVAMIVATKEDKFHFANYDGSDATANGLRSHSIDAHAMLKNALAISLEYWEKDVQSHADRVGNDFGNSGNFASSPYYVSDGLGKWVAASSYFWQRAVAGCDNLDDIWTYDNMVARWKNEVGTDNGTEFAHKNCPKLVEFLMKHNVKFYTGNGADEANLLWDGHIYQGSVHRWVFYVNTTFPENSRFTYINIQNTSARITGVFRPFYVW